MSIVWAKQAQDDSASEVVRRYITELIQTLPISPTNNKNNIKRLDRNDNQSNNYNLHI